MLTFCIALVLFAMWHGMGVTVGLHRLLTHRSFRCPKLVEYFLVAGGYFAFNGSPIWWVAMHRAHHKYSDTPLDPHAPSGGMVRAYFTYRTFNYPDYMTPEVMCPDLLKDPVYRFLEQRDKHYSVHYTLNVVLNILFRVALFACFGWPITLASIVMGVAYFNLPLIFNIISHIPKLGYRNFATNDTSTNIPWAALFSWGDEWHNNHHAFPACVRAGMKPNEFDFSYETVKVLRALGLASHLNERFSLAGHGSVQSIADGDLFDGSELSQKLEEGKQLPKPAPARRRAIEKEKKALAATRKR